MTGTDPDGGPFASLFAGAAEVLERDDLLIIDRLEVGAGFEGLPHLVPAIVSAVLNGPAGRTAAFVLADPSQWSIALSDDDLGAIELASGPTPAYSSASTRIRTRPTSAPRT